MKLLIETGGSWMPYWNCVFADSAEVLGGQGIAGCSV